MKHQDLGYCLFLLSSIDLSTSREHEIAIDIFVAEEDFLHLYALKLRYPLNDQFHSFGISKRGLVLFVIWEVNEALKAKILLVHEITYNIPCEWY